MEDTVHVVTVVIIGVHVCLSSVTMDPNLCGEDVCCPDYILEGDRCIDCPPGRFGKVCSLDCLDGFHGLKCKTECPSKCNKTCDKISGLCPGLGSVNTTNHSFEEELADFVKENMWIIIGVSSIFASLSFIGTILFCIICKSKKEAVIRTFHISDQNSDQLNGLRYERDIGFSNNSSNLQPSHRVHENNTRGEHAASRPECEHSKSKKRYSLVQQMTISQEMTSHSQHSDENDDLYDSDEFDDSFDVCKKVQISDLPKKDSFKTFQSDYIKSNEAYGQVWI